MRAGGSGQSITRREVQDLLVVHRVNRKRFTRTTSTSNAAVTRALQLGERALNTRLSSRPRTHFARLTGEVGGSSMAALVRNDGSAAGGREWLQVAHLLHDPAGDRCGWADPLRTTLALSRSCDRLLTLDVLQAGRPNERFAAGFRAMVDEGAAPPPPFSMEVAPHGEVHRVRLAGEIDYAVADEVGRRLVEIAGSAMEVDLSAVRFLDARGLSALLEARRRVVGTGHEFRLVGALGIVRRVFEVTHLADLLDCG